MSILNMQEGRQRSAKRFLRLVRREIIGLAQDYWKDAPLEADFDFRKLFQKGGWKKEEKPHQAPVVEARPPEVERVPSETPSLGRIGKWHASRPQVMERMWGGGYVLPGGEPFMKLMIAPLGINKEMSILDLSAGIGGMGRYVASEFNAYVTGLESDSELANYGMHLSEAAGKIHKAPVSVYSPVDFSSSRKYDCIIARELFYRVIGKKKFFKTIAGILKAKGQMVFTDYIVEPNAIRSEAVAQWLAREEGAAPISLAEMTDMWVKSGFDVRVNEDLTEMYKLEILRGLKKFVMFLTNNKPDSVTKLLVLKEIETWGHRIAALEKGLKFYRFHAIRK